MLRDTFVFLIIGVYVACFENTSQDDWRKKGFYRPRRNNPSQNNSQNSFQVIDSQNQNRSLTRRSYSVELENKTVTSFRRHQESRNTFKTDFYRNPEAENTYRRPSFYQNPLATEQQEEKSFEKSFYQYLQPPKSTPATQQFGNDFTSNSQNFELQRPVKAGFGSDSINSGLGSNYHNQNGFGTSYTHSHFENNHARNSNRYYQESRNEQKPAYNSFGASYSHNSFGSRPIQSPSPFLSVTPPSRYVSNSGSNVAFTKGQNYKAPDYLPPNIQFKAPLYLPPNFEDPARAMLVPREPEVFEESSETIPVTLPITIVKPAGAMTFPIPDDDETTPPPLTTLPTNISTTTSTTPSTTTVSTTPSTTTLSTTPSTTTVSTTSSTTTMSTTPSTTTEFTTPSTTTLSTTPSTTTVSTTPSTTTMSTTPSTTTVSTTPSTTTMSTTPFTTTVSTTPSTTTMSTTPSTTTEFTTPSTTTMSTTPSTTTEFTTPSTTTMSTTPSTTTLSTTSSTTTVSTTPSTTTPNLERFREDTTQTPKSTPTVTTETTHTTQTTPTTPFQAPGYLPPKRTLYDYPPPETRLIEPVFSTPRIPAPCDCESSYSGIDQRSSDSGPCVPSIKVSPKTTTGPGYSYLPPPVTAGSGHGLNSVASLPMVNLRLHVGGTNINLQVSGGADVDITVPGGCKTCYGSSSHQEDWTQEQFYKVRRNIPSQSQKFDKLTDDHATAASGHFHLTR